MRETGMRMGGACMGDDMLRTGGEAVLGNEKQELIGEEGKGGSDEPGYKEAVMAYQNGDLDTANHIWLSLAQRGMAMAQNAIGVSYMRGEGVEQDLVLAADWFQKAAEKGHARASRYLGEAYELGEGREKNQEEAVRWYHAAAERGDATGAIYLGGCYNSGRGVEQDLNEAFRWYRIAAERGNCTGMHNTASCYAKGKGTETDLEQALYWAKQARENGDEEADLMIEALERIMKPC